MKRIFGILSIVFLVTAVSCTPVTNVESSPTDIPDNSDGGLNPAPPADPDIFPRSTLTPPPVSDPIEPESAPGDQAGYPPLPPPTPVVLPEGYGLPTQLPPIEPYPEPTGNLIWILKPVGEQCAEAPTAPDLQTAVAEMIALGIPVEASEMASLAVCAACGCPTSAHFRVQIDAGYLANAELLDWYAEE